MKKILNLTLIVCLSVVFSILTATAVMPQGTVTGVVTGGSLKLTSPSDIKYTFTKLKDKPGFESGTAEAFFYVEDARGTGEGWVVYFTGAVIQKENNKEIKPQNTVFEVYVIPDQIMYFYGDPVNEEFGPISLVPELTNIYLKETEVIQAKQDFGKGKYGFNAHIHVILPQNPQGITYIPAISVVANTLP